MKQILKKFRIPGLIISLIICLLCGCSKDSINGDLDGRWQIMEMSTSPGENLKEKQLYFNFYLHVCSLSFYGGYLAEANLTYIDDKITLYFPYFQTPEALEKLNKYGIYSNPVTFHVISLTGKKLVIQDGDILITLRKF